MKSMSNKALKVLNNFKKENYIEFDIKLILDVIECHSMSTKDIFVLSNTLFQIIKTINKIYSKRFCDRLIIESIDRYLIKTH